MSHSVDVSQSSFFLILMVYSVGSFSNKKSMVAEIDAEPGLKPQDLPLNEVNDTVVCKNQTTTCGKLIIMGPCHNRGGWWFVLTGRTTCAGHEFPSAPDLCWILVKASRLSLWHLTQHCFSPVTISSSITASWIKVTEAACRHILMPPCCLGGDTCSELVTAVTGWCSPTVGNHWYTKKQLFLVTS